MTDFVSMIVPERIEEAYDRVDAYYTEHLKLSFNTPDGVANVLNELIRDHGESVRTALYAMLCEQDGALRKLTNSALADGDKAAVRQLVPLLVTRFTLPPAVALLVATLVIKAVSANGEQAVCEGMILQHRKVARGVRAREHASATSAAPKVRRGPVGGNAQKGRHPMKKSVASTPPRKVRLTPIATEAGAPTPRGARKPYPAVAAKAETVDAGKPDSGRKSSPPGAAKTHSATTSKTRIGPKSSTSANGKAGSTNAGKPKGTRKPAASGANKPKSGDA